MLDTSIAKSNSARCERTERANFEILRSAIDAFDRGLTFIDCPSDTAIDENQFIRLLITDAKLDRRDEQLVLDCATFRLAGLRLARRGALDAAKAELNIAEALLLTSGASAAAREFSTSLQLACDAYLDFRKKRFKMADSKLNSAIALDLALEESQQFRLLHLHRIQLIHNKIRIAARRGLHGDAVKIAWQLLNYIIGEPQYFDRTSEWDPSSLRSLPVEMVEVMFNQILSELASLTATHEVKSDPRRQFQRAITAADASNLGATVGQQWLKLQHYFLCDQDSFIRYCEPFLKISPCPRNLWLAVAIQLIRLCEQRGHPDAAHMMLDMTCCGLPDAFLGALKDLGGSR